MAQATGSLFDFRLQVGKCWESWLKHVETFATCSYLFHPDPSFSTLAYREGFKTMVRCFGQESCPRHIFWQEPHKAKYAEKT